MSGPAKAVTTLLIVSIGWLTWIVITTGVWRDGEYWLLVNGYRAATRLQKLPDRSGAEFENRWDQGWDGEWILSGRVRASLRAREVLAAATIAYSDEHESRSLYEYRDYTTIADVRANGTDLYLLRRVALLSHEDRLLHYDIARRIVVADRRVSRNDLDTTEPP